MNEQHDVMSQVRESFSGLCMDVPLEQVFARSRARRRRRLSGLTAAAAMTAGAAAAVTLAHGGPAPARSANPLPTGNPLPASQGPVTLAAFSVTSGPGHSTTLTLRKGYRLDASALRADLARHGIPALVTVGTFCRSTPGAPAGIGPVVHPSTLADGSDVLVIDGSAIQPGTRLSIGYFPMQVRMAVIKDGAPLSCGTASRQPATHITPSGTPIRAGQDKR
jgi:hypothetical protein